MPNLAAPPEARPATAEEPRSFKSATFETRTFETDPSPSKAAGADAETKAAQADAGLTEAAQRAAPDVAAYVGYFAGWFDIAQIAAGRQIKRGGLRQPQPHDA